jgi:hypothetical protein
MSTCSLTISSYTITLSKFHQSRAQRKHRSFCRFQTGHPLQSPSTDPHKGASSSLPSTREWRLMRLDTRLVRAPRIPNVSRLTRLGLETHTHVRISSRSQSPPTALHYPSFIILEHKESTDPFAGSRPDIPCSRRRQTLTKVPLPLYQAPANGD